MSDDRHESENSAHGLDLQGLALEAETTPERIRRLVEIGAIIPQADGTFHRGDVVRSRVVAAFEAEGFSLDQMATAIRERAIALQSVPLFYPDPSPRTGRTYGAFVEELGPRGRLVAPALAAMGLSARSTDAPTHVVEEPLLKALIEGWSGVDEAYTLRAARIFGDAARRAAEGWVALFAEAISEPIEARYATIDEVVPRLLEPAAHLAGLSPKLLAWLLERHLERSMNDLNISRIERRLEVRGLLPSRPVHPPAVAFVDVSEFTRRARSRRGQEARRLERRVEDDVGRVGDLRRHVAEGVDADRQAGHRAARARLPEHVEGQRVGHVVADQDGGRRASLAQQPGDGVTLLRGARRTQLEVALAREAFEAAGRIQAVDDRTHPTSGGRDVGCGAVPEGHGRELGLDDQPGLVDRLDQVGGQRPALRQVPVVARIGDDDQRLGPGAARQVAVLQAVVAEIGRATDAHAPGEVDRRAPGQEHDLDAGQTGQASKGTLSERLGARPPGIEPDARDGAVEIAHDQARPSRQGRRGQEAQGRPGIGHGIFASGSTFLSAARNWSGPGPP